MLNEFFFFFFYTQLQNIFMGDDIRQKMPIESIDYDILTEEWKEITVKMHEENNLFRACYSRRMS